MTLLLIGFLFLTLFVAYGYRVRAHRAEVRANRAEGALHESRGHAEKMSEIARQSIEVARERHFPAGAARKSNTLESLEILPYTGFSDTISGSPTFTPPIAANCSRCGVSVRHEASAFPVQCPAVDCHTLIDPVLDSGTVE